MVNSGPTFRAALPASRHGHAPLRPLHRRPLLVDDYGLSDREPDFRTLGAIRPTTNPSAPITRHPGHHRGHRRPRRACHSFKYIAALQAADTGDAPKLIRIETRAGHGAGKPTEKIIEEYADMWAFIAHHTGMRVETPRAGGSS